MARLERDTPTSSPTTLRRRRSVADLQRLVAVDLMGDDIEPVPLDILETQVIQVRDGKIALDAAAGNARSG